MRSKTNIIIAGVGGQGVVTAANLVGKTSVKAGLPVFSSEVHGMAQRGGSVICTVRIGDVSHPLIPEGGADIILGLEPVEVIRYINYANKKTIIITDSNPVIPFTVSIGGEKYPSVDEIREELEKHVGLYMIDALKLAREAGAVITKNIVMLGALSAVDILPFTYELFQDTILESIPEKYRSINKNAFNLGRKEVLKQMRRS
ncbi:MAG: indolepyruvate ferredoxin oxidoreductase subunit beta [Candidatus Thermoplasmatota archaeon]